MSWLNDCTYIETAEDKAEKAQQEVIDQFKRDRAAAIASAVVTTASGKQFDADEQSIGRMGFRLQKAELTGEAVVGWVLADSPAGVKTSVTVQELREAFRLAVENMDANWEIPAE